MGRKRDRAGIRGAAKSASAAPAASRWWPWAVGLVMLAALGVQGPSLGRPFVDRHDWSTAHQAQFAHNHLRYGLGDTLTRCLYTRHIIAGVSNARTVYPDHPPLLSLVLALAMWVGGVNDLAVRLVPALCTVAAIGLTTSIIRRLYDAAVALLAGVALLGLPILVYFGHLANHEPLALACGLLALRGYLGWVYPEAFASRRGRSAVAFAVGTVLAILSGWVGLLFAGVIWLHFALGLRGVALRRSVRAWALVTLPAFSAAVATFAHVLWSLGGGLEKLYGIFAFRAGLKEGVKAFDESPLSGWLLRQGEWLWRDFTVAGLALAAVGLVALLRRRAATGNHAGPGRAAVLWLLGAPGLLFVLLFRTGSYEHDYWWLHVTPLVGLLIALGVATPVRALRGAKRTPVLVAAGVVVAALIGGEAWVRQDFYREPASPSWYEACTYVARETPADTPTYTNMSPWVQREYHDGPMLFLQPQLAWVLDRKLQPLPTEGGIRAVAAQGGVYILMPKNARDQELGEYLFARHRLLSRWRQAAVFELVAEERRGAADGADVPASRRR